MAELANLKLCQLRCYINNTGLKAERVPGHGGRHAGISPIRYTAGRVIKMDGSRIVLNYDRCDWWRTHKDQLPQLSIVAKYMLGIPASAATS